jgi:DNA-directed RNA polymerase subunit N (RpoN/RPB10)
MTPEECEAKADELRSLVFVQQDLINTYQETASLLRMPFERLVVSDRIRAVEFGQCLPKDLYPAVLAILEQRIQLLTEKLDGSKPAPAAHATKNKQELSRAVVRAFDCGENIRYHLQKLGEQSDTPLDHDTYDAMLSNLDDLRLCCRVTMIDNKDEQP